MTIRYYVYVLKSLKDSQLYIGFTTDLKQRFTDHTRGHVKSTTSRRPFELIFYEYYLNKKDASRREKYFKTNMGKRALRLMLKNYFSK